MKPMYLSQEQYDKLADELKHMKQVDRKQVIQEISDARDHGDLKENAEYAAAKEKQKIVEAKILRLEETLSRSRILTKEMEEGDFVHIGSHVKLHDTKTNEEIVYEIVPTTEFDPDNFDAVSGDSPVGKALLGKKVDDSVEIKVPRGTLSYTIVEIS